MNDDEQAAEAAGAALEAALLKATRSLESELTRILRTSESDLERLALNLAETLARLAIAQQPGAAGAASPEAQATSFNEIAAAVARAAMRGSRFT